MGANDLVIDVGDSTSCAELRSHLRERYPGLVASLEHARFAVNSEFAEDDRVIRAGDEVALIGLVSGG